MKGRRQSDLTYEVVKEGIASHAKDPPSEDKRRQASTQAAKCSPRGGVKNNTLPLIITPYIPLILRGMFEEKICVLTVSLPQPTPSRSPS